MACKCSMKKAAAAAAAAPTQSTSTLAPSKCAANVDGPSHTSIKHGAGCSCCSGASGCVCHPLAAKAYITGCPCCSDFAQPSRI
ncbi:uncharacterized protein SAPINGB_P001129 [Magnusiomyces paraingens]|uniref:Uncharacterized protein n=1 Tax=Magnusiomyces paraingens TaxID=2606893 RepID=A0A5E8B466_9ASCO|nr:uncharacterized protein SAPINGB_P001129 [Saprochaete ingens]VVT46268.1 unnamed protein product [Saprochaete ingens]